MGKRHLLSILILSTIFSISFFILSEDKMDEIGLSLRGLNVKYSRILDYYFKREGIRSGFEEGTKKCDEKRSTDSPKVILLWTTWRSGSNFMGSLLANAVPETFYSLEPLHYYGVNILSKNESAHARRYLEDILHCRMSQSFKDQIAYLVRQPFYKKYNVFLMKQCRPVKRCENLTLVRETCNKAKLQVGKIIRLPLSDAWPLLRDKKLDIHVFYLVRDPRAVMASRLRVGFCHHATCHDPQTVCNLFQEDLLTAKLMQEEFPKRFKLIQYEEFSYDAPKGLANLMSFVGLPVSKKQMEMINPRKIELNKAFSIKKDSATVVDRWRISINFNYTRLIQDKCTHGISTLGLRLFHSKDELKDLSLPLLLSKLPKQ